MPVMSVSKFREDFEIPTPTRFEVDAEGLIHAVSLFNDPWCETWDVEFFGNAPLVFDPEDPAVFCEGCLQSVKYELG